MRRAAGRKSVGSSFFNPCMLLRVPPLLLVRWGQVIGVISEADLETQIENARIALENAQLSLKNAQEKLEDYTITVSYTHLDVYKRQV